MTSATFFDCPQTDQRGFLRPVDGDLDGMARCDAGAFEFGAISPADVNGDGAVNCADMVALVRHPSANTVARWGSTPAPTRTETTLLT